MIYRILMILAILILIIDYFVGPTFFDSSPSDNGTFVALMLICIVVNHLLINSENRK
ncbi:hypothetical protein [Sutcliffiella deserti]|uniref:hypothetical protein n=1 Tax=Sutcliffiella deserti TaxID=2875501 RepID=UPI001CBA9B8F|nr:hypothetical protein [Sutcliffiella deserti]